MTHTARTLADLRSRGYTAGVVERFMKFGAHGVRKDLFGIFDIIAFGSGIIIGVQSCGENFEPHRITIMETNGPTCRDWLECGGRVLLYGWRKLKVKAGGKAVRYRPRIGEVKIEWNENNPYVFFKEYTDDYPVKPSLPLV